MRRFGEPVVRGQKYRKRPGAYVILPRDGQILVTVQDGEWQLPGGGIEAGEQPIQTLHREVYEETGWSMGPARKIGAFRRFNFMPEYDLWAEKICHIYVARPILRRGAPIEQDHVPIWIPQEMAHEILAVEGDAYFAQRLFNRG